MRIQHFTIAGTCGLLAITTAAGADPDRADAKEVVAKVEQAVELIRNEGDAAFGVLADPSRGFVWKDTYVFVVNCTADRVIVNPAFPERVGGDIKQHTTHRLRRLALRGRTMPGRKHRRRRLDRVHLAETRRRHAPTQDQLCPFGTRHALPGRCRHLRGQITAEKNREKG